MDRQNRILVVCALTLLAPLAVACTPDRPETELSWNANDRFAEHRSAPAAEYAPRDYAANDYTPHDYVPRGTAKTYVYQGDNYAVPAPKPRPAPPAYQADNYAPAYERPAPRAYDKYDDRSYDRADASFDWPVRGKVISAFGANNNGERNDGINIATDMGAPIRAAASGTVTYAGNELKGYGNLLLLKHAGGYVTAYAHADHLIVGRGESVAKGQVIGYAGTTGDVSTPQLHFEIRRDTTPVDPRNLLVARNS